MIYNITCLVCVTAMLVGHMLAPEVCNGVVTRTVTDTTSTVAGSLRGENITRELISLEHETNNSGVIYKRPRGDCAGHMSRLYFFKYMHSI